MEGEQPFIGGEYRTMQENHNVIIGVAKYRRCGRGFRSKMRRMPNRDSTVNVRELGEMESQVHLILKMTDEMET